MVVFMHGSYHSWNVGGLGIRSAEKNLKSLIGSFGRVPIDVVGRRAGVHAMRTMIVVVAWLIGLTFPAGADLRLVRTALPQGVDLRIARLAPHFGPASRAFIARRAAAIANGREFSAPDIAGAAQDEGLGPLNSADIDALVEMVLMQVVADAEQDLRDQLAAMKNQSDEKKTLRTAKTMQRTQRNISSAILLRPRYTLDRYAAGGASFARDASSLDDALADARNRLDQMNDMGEMEQLRLQMMMDRRAKALEALSNIEKKNADTAVAIVGNLK
jgi:hypothetical protein